MMRQLCGPPPRFSTMRILKRNKRDLVAILIEAGHPIQKVLSEVDGADGSIASMMNGFIQQDPCERLVVGHLPKQSTLLIPERLQVIIFECRPVAVFLYCQGFAGGRRYIIHYMGKAAQS